MADVTLRRDQILDAAKTIINGEREGTYGKADGFDEGSSQRVWRL